MDATFHLKLVESTLRNSGKKVSLNPNARKEFCRQPSFCRSLQSQSAQMIAKSFENIVYLLLVHFILFPDILQFLVLCLTPKDLLYFIQEFETYFKSQSRSIQEKCSKFYSPVSSVFIANLMTKLWVRKEFILVLIKQAEKYSTQSLLFRSILKEFTSVFQPRCRVSHYFSNFNHSTFKLTFFEKIGFHYQNDFPSFKKAFRYYSVSSILKGPMSEYQVVHLKQYLYAMWHRTNQSLSEATLPKGLKVTHQFPETRQGTVRLYVDNTYPIHQTPDMPDLSELTSLGKILIYQIQALWASRVNRTIHAWCFLKEAFLLSEQSDFKGSGDYYLFQKSELYFILVDILTRGQAPVTEVLYWTTEISSRCNTLNTGYLTIAFQNILHHYGAFCLEEQFFQEIVLPHRVQNSTLFLEMCFIHLDSLFEQFENIFLLTASIQRSKEKNYKSLKPFTNVVLSTHLIMQMTRLLHLMGDIFDLHLRKLRHNFKSDYIIRDIECSRILILFYNYVYSQLSHDHPEIHFHFFYHVPFVSRSSIYQKLRDLNSLNVLSHTRFYHKMAIIRAYCQNEFFAEKLLKDHEIFIQCQTKLTHSKLGGNIMLFQYLTVLCDDFSEFAPRKFSATPNYLFTLKSASEHFRKISSYRVPLVLYMIEMASESPNFGDLNQEVRRILATIETCPNYSILHQFYVKTFRPQFYRLFETNDDSLDDRLLSRVEQDTIEKCLHQPSG